MSNINMALVPDIHFIIDNPEAMYYRNSDFDDDYYFPVVDITKETIFTLTSLIASGKLYIAREILTGD